MCYCQQREVHKKQYLSKEKKQQKMETKLCDYENFKIKIKKYSNPSLINMEV